MKKKLNNDLIPNFTMIPNEFLDNLLPQLSPSAWKILSIISRQTYGWHKKTDMLSHSQLQKKSGMSVNTCKNAIKELIEKDIIVHIDYEKRKPNEYGLNLRYQNLIPLNPTISKSDTVQYQKLIQSKPLTVSKSDTTKESIINKDIKKRTTNNGNYKEAKAILDYWNSLPTTNKEKKDNITKLKLINTTINQFSVGWLRGAIANISQDDWSIKNNLVSLNRLIKPDKRNDNMNRFKPDLEEKPKRKKPDIDEKIQDAWMNRKIEMQNNGTWHEEYRKVMAKAIKENKKPGDILKDG